MIDDKDVMDVDVDVANADFEPMFQKKNSWKTVNDLHFNNHNNDHHFNNCNDHHLYDFAVMIMM